VPVLTLSERGFVCPEESGNMSENKVTCGGKLASIPLCWRPSKSASPKAWSWPGIFIDRRRLDG
jgi:hypothetical protein